MITCRTCDTPNDPDATFCKHCGSRLAVESKSAIDSRLSTLQRSAPPSLQEKMAAARSVTRGERRLVTILFADVVGFTALAEKRDPEEARVIMEGCLNIMIDQVHRFEGYVADLLGDGLMAYFGAPITHEDDPERAVRAALGIQERCLSQSYVIRHHKYIVNK